MPLIFTRSPEDDYNKDAYVTRSRYGRQSRRDYSGARGAERPTLVEILINAGVDAYKNRKGKEAEAALRHQQPHTYEDVYLHAESRAQSQRPRDRGLLRDTRSNTSNSYPQWTLPDRFGQQFPIDPRATPSRSDDYAARMAALRRQADLADAERFGHSGSAPPPYEDSNARHPRSEKKQ